LDKLIVDGEVKEGDTVRVEARGEELLLAPQPAIPLAEGLPRGAKNPSMCVVYGVDFPGSSRAPFTKPLHCAISNLQLALNADTDMFIFKVTFECMS